MGSKTAKSPTQPIANFVEKQRQELLSRREEIIANWREKETT